LTNCCVFGFQLNGEANPHALGGGADRELEIHASPLLQLNVMPVFSMVWNLAPTVTRHSPLDQGNE
jgi:hypothetical protein